MENHRERDPDLLSARPIDRFSTHGPVHCNSQVESRVRNPILRNGITPQIGTLARENGAICVHLDWILLNHVLSSDDGCDSILTCAPGTSGKRPGSTENWRETLREKGAIDSDCSVPSIRCDHGDSHWHGLRDSLTAFSSAVVLRRFGSFLTVTRPETPLSVKPTCSLPPLGERGRRGRKTWGNREGWN